MHLTWLRVVEKDLCPGGLIGADIRYRCELQGWVENGFMEALLLAYMSAISGPGIWKNYGFRFPQLLAFPRFYTYSPAFILLLLSSLFLLVT